MATSIRAVGSTTKNTAWALCDIVTVASSPDYGNWGNSLVVEHRLILVSRLARDSLFVREKHNSIYYKLILYITFVKMIAARVAICALFRSHVSSYSMYHTYMYCIPFAHTANLSASMILVNKKNAILSSM